MSFIFLLFFSLQLHLSPLSSSSSSTTASAARYFYATASSCPLDFDILRQLIQSSNRPKLDSDSVSCHYIKAGLQLVQSDYLFLPNPLVRRSVFLRLQKRKKWTILWWIARELRLRKVR
ncbi:hypothetical protein ACSBR2_012372 [Camellia fascicularis]